MPPKLIATLNWIKDNVLAVLIASFVIPGVLAVFNQQSDITKAIYETDYKSAKNKFQECDRVHSEYISAAETNAGTALFIQQHFNPDAVAKRGHSETYFIALKGTMDTFQKSLNQTKESFDKASRCYSELNASYENLALSLDLLDEFHHETKQGADRIAQLTDERTAIRNKILERVDPNMILGALISNDEKSMHIITENVNYNDVAELQSQNIKVESEAQRQQRAQFVALNKIFANELNRRFHRGLLSYFGSLFSI